MQLSTCVAGRNSQRFFMDALKRLRPFHVPGKCLDIKSRSTAPVGHTLLVVLVTLDLRWLTCCGQMHINGGYDAMHRPSSIGCYWVCLFVCRCRVLCCSSLTAWTLTRRSGRLLLDAAAISLALVVSAQQKVEGAKQD